MRSHATKSSTQTYPPLGERFKQEFRYWLFIWTVIYALIIILGLFHPDTWILTAIKIGSVLLCSIYSVIFYPRDHFLHAAMIATFIADCLLAGDNISLIGLTVFLLAQCIHAYRLLPSQSAHKIIWLLIVAFIALLVNSFLNFVPPLFIVCSFYAFTLLLNILTSWRWYKSSRRDLYAFCAILGFCLFACCDLFTGVSYLSLTEVFPAFLYAPANFFAWFFYYPSQIFISNSPKCATIEAKEGKC